MRGSGFRALDSQCRLSSVTTTGALRVDTHLHCLHGCVEPQDQKGLEHFSCSGSLQMTVQSHGLKRICQDMLCRLRRADLAFALDDSQVLCAPMPGCFVWRSATLRGDNVEGLSNSNLGPSMQPHLKTGLFAIPCPKSSSNHLLARSSPNLGRAFFADFGLDFWKHHSAVPAGCQI